MLGSPPVAQEQQECPPSDVYDAEGGANATLDGLNQEDPGAALSVPVIEETSHSRELPSQTQLAVASVDSAESTHMAGRGRGVTSGGTRTLGQCDKRGTLITERRGA